MHKEILTKQQDELLPLLKQFSKEFYLVGGTAIALHLGHRRSIDFDLFSFEPLKRQRIKGILREQKYEMQDILYEDTDQIHIIINSVKMTFFHYPYTIRPGTNLGNYIKIPELIDLAAMKAYALGGRAKWKDYVDLYYILKDHHNFSAIAKRAKEIFGTFFNGKLFREQLCYFKDIDDSEAIDYIGQNVSDEDIKAYLTEVAIKPF